MKSISEVCPNCIERLVPEKKNLGGMLNWFVCPICGFRERPACQTYTISNTGRFIDNIKAANKRMANK